MPMQAMYTRHKETIDRTAFFALVIVITFVFFKYLFSYIAPFFFGALIALIMEPLIEWLSKNFRFKRWMASALCLLLFMGAVGSLGTWMVTRLARQTVAFMEAVPMYVEDFLLLVDDVSEWLMSWSGYTFPDMRDAMISWVAAFFGDGVRDQSMRFVSNVPNFFIVLILTLVSAFFFMKDMPTIKEAAKKRCPRWLADYLKLIRQGMTRAVGGYLRAQVILMTIVGILAILGLIILRNPYALMIGLVIALLDFLPILGSGSVLIPWSVFHFATGDIRQAIGLLALYGVITITRQALEPKILGEQIGIHPLLSLMSVFIGYKIFGFSGIIIGPAIVMVGVAMTGKHTPTK
jgi:sporulation integral membrane protein YtvI